MTLCCFVQQKDGRSCGWITQSILGEPNDELGDLARLITHLMEHIDNLIAGAPNRYQCPDHPTNKKFWGIGSSTVMRCAYADWRQGPKAKPCNRELEPLPY